MGYFFAGQRYGANGDNDISVQSHKTNPQQIWLPWKILIQYKLLTHLDGFPKE